METKQNIQNEKFDFKTFFKIVKQSFIFIIFILLFTGIIAYLTIRYTQPQYTSTAIIQIKSENKTSGFLKYTTDGAFAPNDLDYSIEQIRSKEFIKNVINSLDIQIGYFIQGTILFSELYPNTHFTVNADIKNSNYYDKKFYCEFSENGCSLEINNKEILIPLNEKVSLEGIDIQINIDISQIKELSKNKYFFIIYKENTLIKDIINSLEIFKQNQSAGTILLTYSGINSKKTATITNAIASNFLDYDILKKMERAQNTINYIDEQIDIVGKNLEQTEKALYNFKIANNLITNEEINSAKNNAIVSQTINIETEIMKLDYEISTLKDVSNLIQNTKEIKIYEILALIAGLNSSNLLSNLINSIQDLYNQREMMLFNVTENSNKIKIIDELIANRVKTINDFINTTIKRLTENKKNLLETKNKIGNGIVTDIATYNTLEFAQLTREYTINQEYYSQLINSKIITYISKSGFSTDNQILEKAYDSNVPSVPNRKKIYVISYAIALLIILFFIALRYLFFNKILTISDINETSNVSVLGSIPKFSKKIETSKIVITDYPKSGIAEAFRNIRTKLNFYKIESECRIICVSSTVPREGKTFVSLNLAASFAMLDKKTIILDFDLRKPKIHKSFGVDNKKGLSTILIGEDKLEDCINHSNTSYLDFITSGVIPPNPAELILSKKLSDIINTLKQNYDIIIIDTPPIGIISDAMLCFKYADNSIFVFRSNISLKKYINLIEKEASDNDIQHLVFVLNDCEKNIYHYSSNYYAGYYNDEKSDSKFSLKRLLKKLK